MLFYVLLLVIIKRERTIMTIEIKKTFKNIDDGIANMIAAANADY